MLDKVNSDMERDVRAKVIGHGEHFVDEDVGLRRELDPGEILDLRVVDRAVFVRRVGRTVATILATPRKNCQ